MVTDIGNAPAASPLDKPLHLTDDQQRLVDERTTFFLAVHMVNINTATMTKNKGVLTNSFLRVNQELKANPGYVKRLQSAYALLMEQGEAP